MSASAPLADAGGGLAGPGHWLTDWHLDPIVTIAALGAALLYVLAARHVRALAGGDRRSAPWPGRRTAAFLAGLAVLVASLESGVGTHADELLSTHMAQHVLMTMVAAPLLVAGAPVSLTLRAAGGTLRARVGAAVRSRPARALARPPVAWALFAAATLGTHFSPLYDLAVRSAPVHALEHGLYLATAALFWLPLIGGNPVRQIASWAGRVLYLLLAMIPMTLVGVALQSSTTVRYDAYLAPARSLGVSALADQRLAGALMWVGGTLLLAAATLVLGMQALIREERRALAREAYADARAGALGGGA